MACSKANCCQFGLGGTAGITAELMPMFCVTNSMNLTQPANTLAVQVVSQDLTATNNFLVNVLLEPSQTPFKLTNSVSGGTNLMLSWPADHLGYRLLTQTNNLNKGVSKVASDWGPYNGGYNTTNGASIPIIKPGVTNQYYRLTYP